MYEVYGPSTVPIGPCGPAGPVEPEDPDIAVQSPAGPAGPIDPTSAKEADITVTAYRAVPAYCANEAEMVLCGCEPDPCG